VFPSSVIRARFNIPEEDKSIYKDISIQSRYDRKGVSVLASKAVYEECAKRNFESWPFTYEKCPDCFIFQARFPKNAIMRGMVVQSDKVKNYSIVRLAPSKINSEGVEVKDEFQTSFGRYSYYLPEGTEQVFQVTHEDCGLNYANLERNYTIPGEKVVLMPYNKQFIISKDITQLPARKRLQNIYNKIPPKNFGIIFRTASIYATEEEINQEIEELEKQIEQISAEINAFDRIGTIHSDFISQNVIFGVEYLKKLDKIRGTVIPTINNHHFYKTDNYDDVKFKPEVLMNFIEGLLARIPDKQKEVDEEVEDFYYSSLYPKKLLKINHFKLNGRNVFLTPGIILKFGKNSDGKRYVILRRRMSDSGQATYDGLDSPIEQGDYAIGKYLEGSMFYETEYFDKTRKSKGKYFNINSPLEILQSMVKYVDLEIDVVEQPSGEREIIDRDKLDKAFECGFLSKELYDSAIALAEDIKNNKVSLDAIHE
jgi:Ribonuclease G/E